MFDVSGLRLIQANYKAACFTYLEAWASILQDFSYMIVSTIFCSHLSIYICKETPLTGVVIRQAVLVLQVERGHLSIVPVVLVADLLNTNYDCTPFP